MVKINTIQMKQFGGQGSVEIAIRVVIMRFKIKSENSL